MVRNPKSWRALSLMIAAVVVTACGSPSAQQVPQQPSGAQQVEDPLHLTQEQIQRLQNFMQGKMSQISQEDAQIRLREFQNIVLAPTVDVAALTEHLKTERLRVRERISEVVGYWKEMRDTLTPEQRAILVQLMESQPAAAPQSESFPAQLNLTDVQKQALSALRSPEADRAIQMAIVRFMQEGGQESLSQAMFTAQDLLPPAEHVAQVLAGLSLEQRHQLFGAQQAQAGQQP